MERTFKDAHNFVNSDTGVGLKENDEGTFESAVKKKCPYYYDILKVMSDHASSKPKATSYDSASDSVDELEEEDNAGSQPASNMSDLSEDEKSISTKRSAATTSSKKSKKKSRRQTSEIMDDEAISALNKALQTSEEKMKELVSF